MSSLVSSLNKPKVVSFVRTTLDKLLYVTSIAVFFGAWIFAVKTYGWFLGLTFGWIPSVFLGIIIAVLVPPVLVILIWVTVLLGMLLLNSR